MPKTTDLKPASEHALLRPGDECVLQIPKKQQREQGYGKGRGQINRLKGTKSKSRGGFLCGGDRFNVQVPFPRIRLNHTLDIF